MYLPTISPPPAPDRCGIFYSIRPIDDKGRLIDKVVLDGLGWVSGNRLNWRASTGAITLCSSVDGQIPMTKDGHLWIPARARHLAHFGTGERLLLAADIANGVLLLTSTALLDEPCARLISLHDEEGTAP
ncbi:hypothetical protein AB0E01_37065 [Nocardia vinacea]|uniref:hypothetical protein n=1 Tax=Nocardia vinacea TaxID=96468 RepID=UPI00340EA7C4